MRISLYNSDIGTSNHILVDIREWVLVAVHVWPSGILGLLLRQIVVFLGSLHIRFLILKVDLIIQLVLGVCEVLDGPCVVLVLLVLSFFTVIGALKFSFNFD